MIDARERKCHLKSMVFEFCHRRRIVESCRTLRNLDLATCPRAFSAKRPERIDIKTAGPSNSFKHNTFRTKKAIGAMPWAPAHPTRSSFRSRYARKMPNHEPLLDRARCRAVRRYAESSSRTIEPLSPGLPALLGLALLFLACVGEEVALEPLIRPVLVQPATTASEVQERNFPARAQAGMESALSFKVGGQIREIAVEVGETVRLGQRIAILDDKDLILELRQAEAGYAQASAQDRNARADYARTKRLHDREAASDNKLDAAQTDAVSARATLEAQAQAVALAKAHLGYAELLAPIDGLIAALDVNPNENVTAGQSIVTLNSGGRPEVAFTVPENLIGSIERGQPATVRFTTLDDAVFPAEIVEVGVGSGRSAFPVTARLLDGDERIRSGMVAEITVRFSRPGKSEGPTVIVPAFSVAEDDAGRFVYVALPTTDGLATLERRSVEIGPLSVEGLEVETGLEAGDQIVVAGLRFVEPGMTVRMMTP